MTLLELSQLRALNGLFPLVCSALFATIAVDSVTVGGTNTASHNGHDF